MGQDDGGGHPLVAVAIDRDKSSQNALKWALENLIVKGQTISLVHVNTQGQNDGSASSLFLPFRCFCTRKDVKCNDVVLNDSEVAKAIVDFASESIVEKLVVGASSSKGGFVWKMKNSDLSSNISRGAPDFCTVYVISKGKVSSIRNATRPAPTISPLRNQIQSRASIRAEPRPISTSAAPQRGPASLPSESPSPMLSNMERDHTFRSPFARGGTRGSSASVKPVVDYSMPDSDISFVSSGRPSLDRGYGHQRLSSAVDSFEHSFDSGYGSYSGSNDYSSYSQGSSSTADDVEAEMKRLKLELKQTMDMYSNACKEALTAKQKAMDLHQWKMQDEHKLEEARHAGEAALAMMEREKAKCKAAIEAAEASKRIAELEAQKRINAEKMVIKESEEKKRALQSLAHGGDPRYRKYTIEEIEEATDNFSESRKIGEGGYGPVFKGHLDHTPVAIKVLRPDAAQGRSQFNQEVEILSCIRHPNMVLLLGACPEFGCLVYEHMVNGSLEDRLLRHGNTPPIPWQHRFRIAAEIGTGLLFLHQTKPEPLVHRDLKPANILLDRNYGSKISDVGLARLVPPSVADTVTQYHMTSTAGTFCYIDPEYQQTGMLGVKSDVYSLGILLLQIITAKPPMGLTHHVERSIEKGTFKEMLDPTVHDWPVDAALALAQISLQCAELRRKDRPDLGKVVLPELNRLRALGEDNMQHCFMGSNHIPPRYSHTSQEMTSGTMGEYSGYGSGSSTSSMGRRLMSGE